MTMSVGWMENLSVILTFCIGPQIIRHFSKGCKKNRKWIKCTLNAHTSCYGRLFEDVETLLNI
jgi:hypothetical protein